MPENEIDTSDIPEMPIDWANAKRGVFYGPIKQQITLWLEDLDDDVIAWLKANTPDEQGYQALINQVLSEHIQRENTRNAASS